MTFGIPLACFACFLAFSSIAIFAPRRAPAVAARATAILWPAQVDPRAAGAGVAVRLALAHELGTCQGRWALDTVTAALAEEPDAAVSAALTHALGAIRAAAQA
jgi:hypothetical protein